MQKKKKKTGRGDKENNCTYGPKTTLHKTKLNSVALVRERTTLHTEQKLFRSQTKD